MNKPFAFALLLVLFISASVNADTVTIVTPKIGGGAVTITGVGLIDVDVSFDGTNLAVDVPSDSTPLLRPLGAGYAFQSGTSWDLALTGKAYNYQYGWNADDSLSTLPSGSAVWVQLLDETAGLQTYYRPDYTAILPSGGDIWEWNLGMQHNAYTVLAPTQSVYTADYKVYIGDATTGVPLSGYGSANATFTWNATPVPEPSAIVLLGMGMASIAVVLRSRGRKDPV
jgi:hypothetical protein